MQSFVFSTCVVFIVFPLMLNTTMVGRDRSRKTWNMSEPYFGDYQMIKRQTQLAEQIQESKNLPMLTGRQTASRIYVSFKIDDVQVRAIGIERFAQYRAGQRQSHVEHDREGANSDQTCHQRGCCLSIAFRMFVPRLCLPLHSMILRICERFPILLFLHQFGSFFGFFSYGVGENRTRAHHSTDCIDPFHSAGQKNDLRLLQDPCSGESYKHEWQAQHRVGQKQSQTHRSDLGRNLDGRLQKMIFCKALPMLWRLKKSNQTHRTEPKSFSKLDARVTDVLKDQQQKFSWSSETKRPGERQSNPSRHSE